MFNFIKKYIPVDFAIVSFIWLLAVGLLGLVDFVNFEFDFSRVTSAEYLVDTSVLLFLGLMIFTMTLIRQYAKHKVDDDETNKLEEKLNTEVRIEDTSDLGEFVHEVNLERRKTAYVSKKSTEMQNELSDIISKHPESFEKWKGEENDEKEKDKYCQRLNRLQVQLDEEYIDNNITYLDADFTELTPNFVTTGINRQVSSKPDMEEPSRPFVQAIRDNYVNFTVPMIFVSIILSLAMTPSEEDRYVLLFIIAIKVIVLLFQQYSAKLYAPRFHQVTRVADVHFRYRLWTKYLKWQLSKKKKEREQNGRQPERKVRNTDEHESSADSASPSESEHGSDATATSGSERS